MSQDIPAEHGQSTDASVWDEALQAYRLHGMAFALVCRRCVFVGIITIQGFLIGSEAP
jgi:hypothetical protein